MISWFLVLFLNGHPIAAAGGYPDLAACRAAQAAAPVSPHPELTVSCRPRGFVEKADLPRLTT